MIIIPEENVAEDLLTVMIAELHMTNHQHSVDYNSQRDNSEGLEIYIISSTFINPHTVNIIIIINYEMVISKTCS